MTQGKLVDVLDPEIAGCFKFANYSNIQPDKPNWLLYVCPCGCKEQGALQLSGPFAGKPPRGILPSWDWDGNYEKPTLTPSILRWGQDENGKRTAEHWHGFLKAGVWKSV